MKKLFCCFAGIQPEKLPFSCTGEDPRCEKLRSALKTEIRKLYDCGVTHFLTGMSLGTDLIAAEAVLDLRNELTDITLECVIPCETQTLKWTESNRERYYRIAEFCDKETMIQKRYTANCMSKRNRYMIDAADFLIAVWDGTAGKAANMIKSAEVSGKTVVIIDPAAVAEND